MVSSNDLIVIFSMAAIFSILPLIAFWQIFRKAGFPAPLSLLMLVPLVNVAMLFFLAFSPWKVTPIASSSPNETR